MLLPSFSYPLFAMLKEYGMVDVVNADGSTGVTLKCPKFQEAITFAHVGTGLHDSFEGMAKLDIPVHLLVGEISDIKQVNAHSLVGGMC